ncbi:hypothetical protein FRB90_007071, partial [Tulasnella sp. 427]
MKEILLAIVGPSDKSMLPFIPRPIKLLFALLFILNWRSWPLVWHWKVWKHVFEVRWDAWRKARAGIAQRKRWLFERSCVNADPFEIVSTLQCYAGVDDCDYNMHLSNSCYAKSVDSARMKAAMDVFLPIFGDGGWMPLGGAQYQFIREIPLGTHYEIQSSIGGWEEKWLFLVHHYISYPSKNKRSQTASQAIGRPPMPGPNITAPSTPSLIDSPPRANSPKPVREPYRPPIGIDLSKIRKPLPEGAVVHCVAVSLYCFKIGRITIPPRVAMIASGFGDPSKQRWFRVQDLRFSAPDPMLAGKGKKGKDAVTNRMTDMLKGGWKTDDHVPSWVKPKEAPVDASWADISASTANAATTTGSPAPAVAGYTVGDAAPPSAPSPIDIASPITPADGAAASTPNMASALPVPSNSGYLLSTAPHGTAVGNETLPAAPLTPLVQAGNSFWDLPEFEERRREAMKDVFAGMMDGMKGLREKAMKRARDEQESSESHSSQDPLQPPLKVRRFIENEKAKAVSTRALYPSLYDGLLKELSSETSESSSERSEDLSSISSSNSCRLQEMATRLDKIRRRLLQSDGRIQSTVMLLSTYAAAEDNLEITALLLLLARKVARPHYDLDLEMIVDGLELAAEEHNELQARAKQAERTIQKFEEARVPSGPADIPELCRMQQDAQAAMEETERWAGLLTATEEQ